MKTINGYYLKSVECIIDLEDLMIYPVREDSLKELGNELGIVFVANYETEDSPVHFSNATTEWIDSLSENDLRLCLKIIKYWV
jgi:hypothetical protein